MEGGRLIGCRLIEVGLYLCFTAEVWKKHYFPFKNALLLTVPTLYNVENQKKLQVVVFNIVWDWGEGRARLGR